MEKCSKILGDNPLFADFKGEEIVELFHKPGFSIKKYGKDQIVHLQNEKCQSMDIILAGYLTVQKIDENGNVLTINSFGGGDIVGVNLLFSKRNTYPMTVISSHPTMLIQIKKEIVLELCKSKESFMVCVLGAISDKAIILTDKINEITFKTIRQCILDFLKYEELMQNSRVIQLRMSKKDLAERLGVQRTSLSRELNKMRKEGLVEYDAWSITIKETV